MIEINLLFEELRKKETVKIAMPEIPIKKTLFISVGAVLGLQTLFTLFTLYLRVEDSMLKNDMVRLRASGEEVFQRKADTTAMQNRLRDIRTTTTRPFHWASLLSALTNSTTKGVWLRSLYVTDEEPKAKGAVEKKSAAEGGKKSKADEAKKAAEADRFLVIEGSAVGQGQETAFIGKFLKQLKDDPFFTELFVEIKPYNINQRRFNDFDVYDFMMYCKFKKGKQ